VNLEIPISSVSYHGLSIGQRHITLENKKKRFTMWEKLTRKCIESSAQKNKCQKNQSIRLKIIEHIADNITQV